MNYYVNYHLKFDINFSLKCYFFFLFCTYSFQNGMVDCGRTEETQVAGALEPGRSVPIISWVGSLY